MTAPFRTAQTRCPKCGKLLDAHSRVGGGIPDPGDLTVCIYCEQILTFTHDLALRTTQTQELAELDADDMRELLRTLAAIRAINRQPK